MCVRLSHSLNRSHWSQSKTCLFVRLKWRFHANQHKNGKKIIIEKFYSEDMSKCQIHYKRISIINMEMDVYVNLKANHMKESLHGRSQNRPLIHDAK